MNLKLLDDMFYGYESPIIGYCKSGKEAVLIITDITSTLICRIKFMDVVINEDIEPRLAFDLNNAMDFINLGIIEINGVEYGKRDDGKYFFKAELVQIPEKYFDYSKLGIMEYDYYGETMEEKELPLVSFVADEIKVELFEKIEDREKSHFI